jgi:hypothetical protein
VKRTVAIFVFVAASAMLSPVAGRAQSRPDDKGDRKHHSQKWKDGQGDRKPGQWLRKYNNLPPEKQEQMLKQEPDFQKLPSDRQQRLLDRLRRFNQLPPDQREKMITRMERFEQLSPQQRERLLDFHKQLQSLPEDRRDAVRRAFRRLHTMTPDQRQQVFASERFKSMFDPKEQELIRNMAESDVDE